MIRMMFCQTCMLVKLLFQGEATVSEELVEVLTWALQLHLHESYLKILQSNKMPAGLLRLIIIRMCPQMAAQVRNRELHFIISDGWVSFCRSATTSTINLRVKFKI